MRVVLAKSAAEYLRHERAYLDRFNPRAAEATMRQFQAAFRLLAAHPEAGMIVSPLPGRRRFVCGAYVIDYRIEHARIAISHIRHGRQLAPELDWDKDDLQPE